MVDLALHYFPPDAMAGAEHIGVTQQRFDGDGRMDDLMDGWMEKVTMPPIHRMKSRQIPSL